MKYIISKSRSRDSALVEKYPSWPKGLPWKGSRSLTAARGFKSLLLRYFDFEIKINSTKIKKVVDK